MTYVIYVIATCIGILGIGLLKPKSGAGRFTKAKRNNRNKGLEVTWNRVRSGECWERNKKDKVDKEIYEAISFLRNITSVEKYKEVNCDYIIEQLADKEGILQSGFIKMLNLYRINRKDEAAEMFCSFGGTEMSRQFAVLLLRWDEAKVGELSEILISHQRTIKEIRLTAQRKKDEAISDVVYLPVILNVLLIFINFIYVGYFIAQREMFQMLF